MNTLVLTALVVVASGPFSAAIDQVKPAPQEEIAISNTIWAEQLVGNTSISLPVPEAIETKEYSRTAPANYKMPMPTKRVPVWCPVPGPRHGYNCGMNKAVEDLAGHLQSVHDVTLELCNQIGRDKWQDYHDDLHWCEETEERQQQFLKPEPAKKSGCGPNGCPTTTYRTRRLFGGWR